MKNYLATKWKSLRAWSSVTWGQGHIGKAKVVLAWYGLAVVAMAPVALLMPGLQLELRSDMTKPALLCHQQQSFDEIIGATDVTNQALLEKFRHRPEVLTRIVTSDSYIQRSNWVFQQELMRKIARGQCREVTHGDPVKADWMEWQSLKDADPLKPKRMQVTYQGQTYWAYAGQWQKVTGKTVAAENRAPLRVSPKSLDGNDHSAPPVRDESQAQSTPNRHPVPPFARNESYAQVRVVLMRDGWQPVISKDTDQCMEGDTRCEGRPEMQTCSGSGLAMCRFRWQRDGQQLTICTAGEEQAMFHSICE
jgi:hypothetical protein